MTLLAVQSILPFFHSSYLLHYGEETLWSIYLGFSGDGEQDVRNGEV